MRPKAFPRFPAFYRPGEYRLPSDDDLEPGIIEIIQTYRARLWRKQGRKPPDSEKGRRPDEYPKRADIRETLRRLANMEQGEAAGHWRMLDPGTRAEINAAHHKQFRAKHGQGVAYRKGAAYFRAGPDNLPELAAMACRAMAKTPAKGGRAKTSFFAVQLAAALAAHWWRTRQSRPSLAAWTGEQAPTVFQEWASRLFLAAGYSAPDFRTLRDGIGKCERDGRIPHE
jgi:hypothetical protein